MNTAIRPPHACNERIALQTSTVSQRNKTIVTGAYLQYRTIAAYLLIR